MGFLSNSLNHTTAFSFKFSFQTHEVTNHGVFTLVNLEEASPSKTKVVFPCCCRYVAGTFELISPSMVSFIISLLLAPQAKRTILFAFRTVPIPMVIAFLGTFSIPKKEVAASTLVI